MELLHFIPADSFIKWLAANPGWEIVAAMWTYPQAGSLIVRKK